jgi:predicted DNA-binding antitoxin AbrB/MazE fold protein
MTAGKKPKGSNMEALTINAVYENGKLTPLTPLPCHDKEQVLLKVVRQSNVEKSQGLLKGLDPETVQDVAESHEFSVLA